MEAVSLLGARPEDLSNYANDNNVGMHIASAVLGSPLINRAEYWPELKTLTEAKKMDAPNLANSERGDLLTEYSNMISGQIRFPKSTAWLHGLGCVSSALNKAFKIQYGYDDLMSTGLFVATAQPPSVGKSSINNSFSTPILMAYKKLNDRHSNERKSIQREIKSLERKLDSGKLDEYKETEALDTIEAKTNRLNEIPEWRGVTSNATIESLENVAGNNVGMWNIVSAESDGLNVAVGSVYGDGKSKANIEILLKAWSGEWFSSERITRSGYSGEVRGAISVLAQDDTLDTMLAAGESGRGLTERFLMLSEKSLLGYRDYDDEIPYDKSLKQRYTGLINNIILEDEVVLNFSSNANLFIKNYKRGIEPKMREGGEYSDNMLTGFIGKADKHIRKIASVLHCIDNWQDGGQRSRTITDDYVIWAAGIFDELSKTFVNSADYMGYVGTNSEIQKMAAVLTDYASKNKLKPSVTMIRDKVRNVKPFKGSRNIALKIKDEVLPAMEALNYCVVYNNTVHINPRLK